MSNTALYQCEDCGYSTNNPVAFALHPCRPSNGVNWNSRFAAILAAAIIALATLTPVKADSTEPPIVGGGPSVAIEHKVYLPLIQVGEDEVTGTVSWRPSGS